MNIEIIKIYRENLNYTMQDIANILNISKSSYSLWEEGIERIPLERLIELCDLFSISIDYATNNSCTINYNNSKKGFDKLVLAKNLKTLRKQANLTQDKLAQKMNLGRTTIINYEKGKTLPLLDHLLFLSKIYNTSIDFILGKIDEPQNLK